MDGRAESPLHYQLGACTHMGRARASNEDHFVVWKPPRRADSGLERLLLAVADGMGGHAAGARASHLATDALVGSLHAAGADASNEDALVSGFAAANSRILEYQSADASTRGMGTTLVAATLEERDLTVASIGDSRCYLLRRGELRQITSDHTVAGAMLAERADADEPSAMEESALAHQLTRCVGIDAREGPPDMFHDELEPGDSLLLASDGLTGPVPRGRIARIMDEGAGPWETSRALVEAALEAGGPDNITAVVASIDPVTP